MTTLTRRAIDLYHQHRLLKGVMVDYALFKRELDSMWSEVSQIDHEPIIESIIPLDSNPPTVQLSMAFPEHDWAVGVRMSIPPPEDGVATALHVMATVSYCAMDMGTIVWERMSLSGSTLQEHGVKRLWNEIAGVVRESASQLIKAFNMGFTAHEGKLTRSFSDAASISLIPAGANGSGIPMTRFKATLIYRHPFQWLESSPFSADGVEDAYDRLLMTLAYDSDLPLARLILMEIPAVERDTIIKGETSVTYTVDKILLLQRSPT